MMDGPVNRTISFCGTVGAVGTVITVPDFCAVGVVPVFCAQFWVEWAVCGPFLAVARAVMLFFSLGWTR